MHVDVYIIHLLILGYMLLEGAPQHRAIPLCCETYSPSNFQDRARADSLLIRLRYV